MPVAALGLAGCGDDRSPPPPPAQRVEVVEVAPSPRHVWVEGHWAWHGGEYVWVPGHWAERPHEGAVWVPGHYVQRRHGYEWVPGHWR